MTRCRRLGEILTEDFGWDAGIISESSRSQSELAEPRPRIGQLLRKTVATAKAPDIPLALMLQRLESIAGARSPEARSFDSAEYSELGEMLRDERRYIDNKLRSYAAILVGIVLYIAHPLNLVLATPQARPSDWPGLLVLYSSLGIALVITALFTGDNVVKSYASFLKRRTRIAMARRQLRAANILAGTLTPTAMPMREPALNVAIPERPDPQLTGFQRAIPIYYSLWSLLKLGLLLYFVACLVGETFAIARDDLKVATAITLVATVVWCHFLALMCERYHKTLKEAELIRVENPFPRVSTFALRSENKYRVARWGVFWWHSITAAAVVGIGAYQLLKGSTEDGLLWTMTGALAIHFLGRVLDVLWRMSLARTGPRT